MLAEDVRHEAFVVRRKVLDDHEAQAAVRRHGLEELLQRFQTAGGSADAHDERGFLVPVRSSCRSRDVRLCHSGNLLMLYLHHAGTSVRTPARKSAFRNNTLVRNCSLPE